jgi:hypothetical protein
VAFCHQALFLFIEILPLYCHFCGKLWGCSFSLLRGLATFSDIRFGSRGSEVQILSPRPVKSRTYGFGSTRVIFFSNTSKFGLRIPTARTIQHKKSRRPPKGLSDFNKSTWFPPGRSHTSIKILSTALGLHNLMAKIF